MAENDSAGVILGAGTPAAGGPNADGEATAASVFYGTYRFGVVLQHPAQNPATVAAAGYVTNRGKSHHGDAVYGTGAAQWSLTNLGTIRATKPQGDGVRLAAGGSVANEAGGLIAGALDGIAIDGAAGTVVNYADVAATGVHYQRGVYLAAAGVLDNRGTIAAGAGTQGVGAYLMAGGSLVNRAGGLILGSERGVAFGGGTAAGANDGTIEGGQIGLLSKAAATALVNSGVIADTGPQGYGVYLYAGGSFTNAASGRISGYHGLWVTHDAGSILNQGNITATGANGVGVELLSSGNTVVNAGTIGGTGGAAFSFGNGQDMLVLEPGAVLQGAIARFQPLETIDLAGRSATGLDYTGDAENGVLSVVDNGTTVASLALSGRFRADEFVLAGDGSGGSDITVRQPPGPILGGVYYEAILLGGPIGTSATVLAGGIVAAAYGNAVRNIGGAVGTLTNAGTVLATEIPRSPLLNTGAGVYLGAGGLVSNAGGGAGGLIEGFAAGVAIGGGAGIVVNSGMIAATGSAGIGILLGAGNGAAAVRTAAGAAPVETVANSGTVAGYVGIMAEPGSANIVTNAGTVAGSGGVAVALAGGDDRLVVDPGAVFQGVADGGGGQSVLELALPPGPSAPGAITGIGTLSGLDSMFVDFNTVAVDAGARWQLSGMAENVDNDGVIIARGLPAGSATLALGAVAADNGSTGIIQIGGGAAVEFISTVSAAQRLSFLDRTGTVLLDDPQDFAATFTGFRVGDTIDLVANPADAVASFGHGRLALTENGAPVATLSFKGRYTAAQFQLTDDGNGGTDIVLAGARAALFGAGDQPPPLLPERDPVPVLFAPP